MRILITTVKSWNIEKVLKRQKEDTEHEWHLITSPEDFTAEAVGIINPDYIFLPHWSWRIPKAIWGCYETIVFHPSDLPYGRGGTPIQNQIIEGKYDVKLSAIRVNEEIDAGDIYLKKDFSLAQGSVEMLLKEASDIYFELMIPEIIHKKIQPIPQKGQPTQFARRTPEESDLSLFERMEDTRKCYDFIRMLDGEGYPRAYISTPKGKLIFSNAKLSSGKCTADITFEPR